MSDIYTVEKRIDYIIEFLEDRLETNKTLYEPTRHRLENFIEKFNRCIELTTKIIQEEELQDEQEFDENYSQSIDMEQILESIHNLEATIIGKTYQKNPVKVKTVSQSAQLSISEKKEIISQYRECINQLVETVDNCEIPYVRECAYIIKQWFDARYKIGETTFKYDVKTLPMWIYGIVITYSHNILTNTTQDFVIGFSEWIDNIDINAMYSTYPVPYNIYMNINDVCVDEASLTAEVLWDLLFDNGLYRLLASKVPVTQNSIRQLYAESKNVHTTSTIEKYKYYKDDKNILYTSKLLTKAEGEDNA